MNTRNDEMRRGRETLEKNRRASDLERLNACGKVAIRLENLPGGPSISGYLATFVVDGVDVCQERTQDPAYPSDRVMAFVNLAIAATSGFADVPPPTPTHKVSAKAYNKRLQEQNQHRWNTNDSWNASRNLKPNTGNGN